jgi:glutaredoxin
MKKEVVLYSTGCPKCRVLKSKLSDNGIDYKENTNVGDMIKLGIEQVPVLSIDGVLYDFKQAVNLINGGLI